MMIFSFLITALIAVLFIRKFDKFNDKQSKSMRSNPDYWGSYSKK